MLTTSMKTTERDGRLTVSVRKEEFQVTVEVTLAVNLTVSLVVTLAVSLVVS